MEESNVKKVVESNTKFITVTGGVCSSIGKGVLLSSIGVLLKSAGYSVAVLKFDPYLNVDPGTMSPLEHGEVFVTTDGAETDLDLGHYERIMQLSLTRDSSVTSGQIFEEILKDEREGKFLGRCIQFVPHVVDAIKNRLYTFSLKKNVDFVLVEIGGTVGDMEGNVFLEAIRQVKLDLGSKRLFHVHMSYVPYLSWSQEIKTKPTQHSVQTLKGFGIFPDSLALRAEKFVEEKPLHKLSLMCGIEKDLIFQVLTYNPIYKLFLSLQEQGLAHKIQHYFGIEKPRKSDLAPWNHFISLMTQSTDNVRIALVAKYVGSNDPYISVVEALVAAGYWNQVKVNIVVIDAQDLENEQDNLNAPIWQQLKSVNGIVVPGGFDKRGIEGKIMAAQFARQNNIPYLGLCLGMQVMLIEYARNILGMKDANSTEFDNKTAHPVISLLAEQEGITQKGASMRLGTYPCHITKGSLAYQAYNKELVHERHRHRYEFNNKYRDQFEKAGVTFSGIYPEKNLVEISEVKQHPFMLGTQAHPEFNSSPLQVNPLFLEFMKAVTQKAKK